MPTSALRLLTILGLVFVAFGCADAEVAAEQCSAPAPSECSEPDLRYADMAPIFDRYCAACHTGVGIDPWSLDSYENVADWADLLRDELSSCSMPPPGSNNPLPNRERVRILSWLRCGLRE